MTETLPWPVQQVAEWMPIWKGAGFFLATFVLEDLAAVGAGLLLAAGAISWPVAFASCFLGIWLGDAGLYSLARFGGRQWFERSSFKKYSAKVTRSEQWFARRGALILIFSRCVPGARLPTYLAAGFLRLPLPRFLVVTGAAAFVWTLVILWLAQTLGARLVRWVEASQHAGWLLLGTGIVLVVVFQSLRRVVKSSWFRKTSAKIERWGHWEFWPAWLFYPPVVFYYLWLAVKYRGFNVPTAANPGIFSGGIVGESKMAMLGELFATSPEFTAEAALVAGDTLAARRQALDKQRVRLRLEFPFILKDVGQRGAGIKLVRNEGQVEHYLGQTSAPLVAQRYAPGPFEAGIFYYRFPREPRGKIFAITEKIFPVLTGDGRSTIGELIGNDARARLISATYRRRFFGRWNEVLADGETLRMVEAGNHAQGCIFRDGMRLNSPELEARIDDISQKVSGFFIGRYDIRFTSEEDLRAGRNFQIIELNGAASEATSIYDARNSLWSAYRTLFRQWELVFAIGAANRARGFAPTKIALVWKTWRDYSRVAATYPAAD
ncbi:MAG: DedA family protein [Verrucomicrobia bacterium]|nr:DedA family protein [Verrucomicrobiota bacterium]